MRFGILGPVEIDRDGVPIGVPGVKQRALLALLVAHAGEVVSVDRLVEALWGQALPANPRNALQSQVAQLRRRLAPDGEQLLRSHPPGYVLDVDDDAIDARRFARLLGDARDARHHGDLETTEELLTEALMLWRGAALPELDHLTDATAEAARLQELWLTAQEERAEVVMAAGRHGEAVAQLERLVADHPLREGLRGLLMLALYRVGRQADALRTYHDARAVLQEELGIDPSPALVHRYEALLRQDAGLEAPAHDTVTAPVRSGQGTSPGRETPGRLPAPLSGLVGRDHDVERVLALVEAGRLVTLVGPGGVGKTRLAIEAAHRAREVGLAPDGAWLVELASVEDPSLLPEAVADTLGLQTASGLAGAPDGPADASVRLLAALRGRHGLLVLDNCEHLVQAAAALAHEVLTAAPDLTVLCTSREALGVTGERVWPLPSLSVPPTDARTPDEVGRAGAVQLFVERAVQVDPSFTLDGTTAPGVVDVCRRLDGIPLALELAAARVRTLGVGELAARLDDRFALLTSGDPTSAPRQRTLEAVVAWSWHLLEAPERALFRRLAVFAGPVELAAVEAVGADGELLRGGDVLPLLDALVAKSLVVAEPHGPVRRYRLLETLRSYADARLVESGEEQVVRRRHADHLAATAALEVARLRTPDQLTAMVRLDEHLDEFRSCLRWLQQTGDHARGARMTVDLGWYWYLRGHREEGVRWMGVFEPHAMRREAALSRLWQLFLRPDHQRLAVAKGIGDVLAEAVADVEADGRATDRAFAGLLAANLAANLGEHEAFAPFLEAARRAISECGDQGYAATADFVAGQRLLLGGDVTGAKEHVEAALRGFEQVGDRWGLVQCHIALAGVNELVGTAAQAMGHVDAGLALADELRLRELEAILHTRRATLAVADDLDAAKEAVAEAARLADELGWVYLRRQVDLADGLVALRDGRLHDAERSLRRTLEGLDVAVNPMLASYVLARLGAVAELRGELDEAVRWLSQALARARSTGDPRSEARALEVLAAVRAAAGADRDAAVLLGAAAARREGLGLPLPDGEEAVDARRAASLARARLGADAFEGAVAEGRTLPHAELPLPPVVTEPA